MWYNNIVKLYFLFPFLYHLLRHNRWYFYYIIVFLLNQEKYDAQNSRPIISNQWTAIFIF